VLHLLVTALVVVAGYTVENESLASTAPTGVVLECVQCASWENLEYCQDHPNLLTPTAVCTLTNNTEHMFEYVGYPSFPPSALLVELHGSWRVSEVDFYLCAYGMEVHTLGPGQSIKFEHAVTVGEVLQEINAGRRYVLRADWLGPAKIAVELKYARGDGSIIVLSDYLLASRR
jgi:hypothetical protein